GLYVALPAEAAMPYYTVFPTYLPTSMIQNSVPASDMSSLKTVLDWVGARVGSNDVLITQQSIYGWARAYLSPGVRLIDYAYSSPLEGVSMAKSLGYSTIWTIWWMPGLGWYNQAYLPSGFATVFQEGNMAVYTYN
ncbi:MAG TPA: hypothetical protein VNA15_09055, partial [Candidatus Angelobacter sp.]|nr:hypothetical protein [Candidatus Angelobacter sp.]